jgi:hypothetical protein
VSYYRILKTAPTNRRTRLNPLIKTNVGLVRVNVAGRVKRQFLGQVNKMLEKQAF